MPVTAFERQSGIGDFEQGSMLHSDDGYELPSGHRRAPNVDGTRAIPHFDCIKNLALPLSNAYAC